MTNTKIEIQKYLALLEEFETSNKLIRLGFGELQYINLNNDFYFLPFQLLSQGFERFMKAYICVGHFEKHSSLPNYNYLKNLGHDLEKLLKDILQNYYNDYGQPQFLSDKNFLNNNSDLKELLYILSEFGKIARYYNFDFITDNKKIGIDTKSHWQKFENRIMPINSNMISKLMNHDLNNEVLEEISKFIIIVFEKFVAGLSRQIIFNTLGQTGKQITSSSFYDWGLLYEKDFGKTDYRKDTTKYKEEPKKIHKRNIFDKLNRRFNSNYKYKKILKSVYEGDWPFYVDEITIECRRKHWCIVTIKGYDYALNGAAKGRYKLENPHDAGMAILGKSIGDFIKIALEL